MKNLFLLCILSLFLFSVSCSTQNDNQDLNNNGFSELNVKTNAKTCESTNNLGPQKIDIIPVSEGDLFVSPDGTGNSCSQGNPCSLETAISESSAGDIVLLKGGIYYAGTDGFRFEQSGEIGAPIIYASYPGQLAVIDGSQINDGSNTRIRVTGDWNTIRRIEIRNMPDVGLFIDGNHNLIDGVVSHGNYYSGIQVFSPYSSYPYGDQGSYNTIQNSITYNNFDKDGWSNGGDADGISISSGEGNKVLHNLVYDNSDDGIDVWRSTNSVVAYNIVANNGRADGNGNGIKAGGSDPSNGTFVHHNIAYGNRLTGIDYNLGNNLNFFNNTSYNNSYGYSGDSAVTLKNNISFGNEREWVSSAQNERNSWQNDFDVSSSDFMSLNPKSGKFLQLAPGSDLINAGVDVGFCFEGNAPDLGAYEYGAK